MTKKNIWLEEGNEELKQQIVTEELEGLQKALEDLSKNGEDEQEVKQDDSEES